MYNDQVFERLFQLVSACRKAQNDYYGYRGDPKIDPIKKAYFAEAKRREQDLDRLLTQLRKLYPNLVNLLTV